MKTLFLLILGTICATICLTSPLKAQAYYGEKWGADGLANTTVNASDPQSSYRFQAVHSGILDSVHTFFICAPGYGAGTGGSYRVDLETDDGTVNHFPSGSVLATATELSPTSNFTTETFVSPATISTGNLYHVVYTNIDASPSANYCSLDMMWWSNPAPDPWQITISDLAWAHICNCGGSIASPAWHLRSGATPGDGGNYMPTLELAYDDGATVGNGYMESWINTSRKTITGANQTREEILAVSGGDKTVTSITIRMKKDSGTDPLTVTLKTGAGATIESGTIPAASFVPSGEAGDNWVTYNFSSPRILTNGSAYNLILSTPGTSEYSQFPLRKGITHNFDSGTFFADGHAQFSTDTGASFSNWPDESANPSAEADMQFFFALALPASTTHYISSATGSDSNSGTSEGSPWAHLPGMPAATSNAAAYSAVAGDQFILRGCDVWYNTPGTSNFPIQLNHGGTFGNSIYIGVDKTWYNVTNCPTTWNRPIFDGHTSGASSVGTQMGGTTSGCPAGGNMFVQFSASNITLDWIEMRNLFYHNDAEGSCYGTNLMWSVNNADFITVSNGYQHDWVMNTPYNASTSNDTDILVYIQGTPLCPHCLMDHNVSNNCAATSGAGPFPGGAMNMTNVTHSIFKCHSNSYKPTIAGEFGWNEITLNGESPDPTIHANMIETLIAGGTGIYYIHDNRIHDNFDGEGGQIGNQGETDYIWNNIWWNDTAVGSNGPQVPQSETPVAMYYFNNIIVDWTGCITSAGHGYTWSGAFRSQNNLCIPATGSSNSSGSPISNPAAVISNNIGLSIAGATSAGYTAGQSPYVYFPTSMGSPTVGTGVNLTALMPAGFAATDSSMTCTQQTVSTVVQSVCTGTPIARPSSGAWDVGAYQFTSGGTPQPPTNVKALLIQ